MEFENKLNHRNRFRVLFSESFKGCETEFDLYQTSAGREEDKFRKWQFDTIQDWYAFTNDAGTKLIYRGNRYQIGFRKQEDSFLTFNPEKKAFVNKPSEYPTAKVEEDGKYSVTLFSIDTPRNVDKRQRVFLGLEERPKESNITLDVAMVYQLKETKMKEGEALEAASSIGGQLKLAGVVFAQISPIMILIFMYRLSNITIWRNDKSFRENFRK